MHSDLDNLFQIELALTIEIRTIVSFKY
jgi:hypothetical protein